MRPGFGLLVLHGALKLVFVGFQVYCYLSSFCTLSMDISNCIPGFVSVIFLSCSSDQRKTSTFMLKLLNIPYFVYNHFCEVFIYMYMCTCVLSIFSQQKTTPWTYACTSQSEHNAELNYFLQAERQLLLVVLPFLCCTFGKLFFFLSSSSSSS